MNGICAVNFLEVMSTNKESFEQNSDFEIIFESVNSQQNSQQSESINNQQSDSKSDESQEKLLCNLKKKFVEVMQFDNLEEDFSLIEEAIMTSLIQHLQINQEELLCLLSEKNLDILDLLENTNLQEVVQDFFGIENANDVLFEDEYSVKIREVFSTFDSIREKINKDFLEESTEQIESIDDSIQINQSNIIEIENQDSGYSENSDTFDETLSNFQETFLINEKDTDSTYEQAVSGIVGKIAEHMEINLDNIQEQYSDTNYENIVKQIVEKIELNFDSDIKQMTFKLNPEHLGKVSFTILSQEGIVSARFMAENNLVKEAIDSRLIFLKETLEEQGIQVDKVEVVTSEENLSFSQENQEDTNNFNKPKAKRIFREIDEMQIEETEPQILTDDATVNYFV